MLQHCCLTIRLLNDQGRVARRVTLTMSILTFLLFEEPQQYCRESKIVLSWLTLIYLEHGRWRSDIGALQSYARVTSNMSTQYNALADGFLLVHAQKTYLGIISVSRPITNTSAQGTDIPRSDTWHRYTLEVDL